MELMEEVTVVNPKGMHARPAAKLVKTVLPFQSEVHLRIDGQRVNAKSIMGLLTLAASQGTRIEVVCEGPDAQDAMQAIRDLFYAGFDEMDED